MCQQALEEVKLREMAIIDLQKKIGEAENKFKQQQNLYEAVRVDRNMYSKKLIESQDEIQEMKRKFKNMNHQIEQLKDEISAKDMALVKEHFDHLRVRLGNLLAVSKAWNGNALGFLPNVLETVRHRKSGALLLQALMCRACSCSSTGTIILEQGRDPIKTAECWDGHGTCSLTAWDSTG